MVAEGRKGALALFEVTAFYVKVVGAYWEAVARDGDQLGLLKTWEAELGQRVCWSTERESSLLLWTNNGWLKLACLLGA